MTPSIEDRLLELERNHRRQVRHLRLIALAGVLVAFVTIIYLGVSSSHTRERITLVQERAELAAVRQSEDIYQRLKLAAATYPSVRTKSIELVDASDRVRVTLQVDADGSVWQKFLDGQNGERMRVGVTADGVSRLRLLDEKQRPRWSTSVSRSDSKEAVVGTTLYSQDESPLLALTAADAEAPAINVYDTKGTVRVSQAMITGWPCQTIYDADGKIRAQLNLSPAGQTTLLFRGANEKTHVMLSDSADLAAFYLCDSEGRTRIRESVSATGWSGSEQFDGSGKKRFEASTTAEAKAGLWMLDSNEKSRIGVLTGTDGDNALFVMWDQQERLRLNQGISAEGLAYTANLAVDGKAKMAVSTGADGSFDSYIYKTAGEQAWETTSNVLTGLDLLDRLLGNGR